jgi:hypothetical protein
LLNTEGAAFYNLEYNLALQLKIKFSDARTDISRAASNTVGEVYVMV